MSHWYFYCHKPFKHLTNILILCNWCAHITEHMFVSNSIIYVIFGGGALQNGETKQGRDNQAGTIRETCGLL